MPNRRLKKYLDENKVPYRVITHPAAYTSQETVQAAHESGKEFAKCVMLKADGRLIMAVLPAANKVNFDDLAAALDAQNVALATEAEFKDRFSDCETGAMPPFGELYGIDAVIDGSLAWNEMISFNAGTHREMVKMRYKDFERLISPRTINLVVITVE